MTRGTYRDCNATRFSFFLIHVSFGFEFTMQVCKIEGLDLN